MFRTASRLASLGATALLLSAGCEVPMQRLLLNGPPTPGPLSAGLTPPLDLTKPPSSGGDAAAMMSPAIYNMVHRPSDASPAAKTSSVIYHMVYRPSDAPAVLPNPVAVNPVGVSLDGVLRTTCERNPEILVARERVNESQAAFNAAVSSCLPDMLRKDTFKKPVAEATLWRRRAELRKTQTDKLQDAGNTYIDILTARRGEAIGAELQTFEQQLLDRAKKLVGSGEKPAQVIVEAIETVLNNQRQFNMRTHQQGDAAAAKLAYLLGVPDGAPAAVDETLAPVDVVDATVPVPGLIQQAQANGPGVVELQGLAAAIQQGIDSAQCAQCICERTGAPMVCGRLQMAQSELQQAQLALVDLHGKLRAGVEESVSSIRSGRDQIAQASSAIQHAAETYRLMETRLKEQGEPANLRNNTYNAVLQSIQQLSQAHSNYLTAVSAYNKAQVRLLLLLGTYNNCHAKPH